MDVVEQAVLGDKKSVALERPGCIVWKEEGERGKEGRERERKEREVD